MENKQAANEEGLKSPIRQLIKFQRQRLKDQGIDTLERLEKIRVSDKHLEKFAKGVSPEKIFPTTDYEESWRKFEDSKRRRDLQLVDNKDIEELRKEIEELQKR